MALCTYTELCLVKVQEGAKQIITVMDTLLRYSVLSRSSFTRGKEYLIIVPYIYIYIIYIYIIYGAAATYDVKEFVLKIMQYVLISIPEMRICASLRRTLPAACTP